MCYRNEDIFLYVKNQDCMCPKLFLKPQYSKTRHSAILPAATELSKGWTLTEQIRFSHPLTSNLLCWIFRPHTLMVSQAGPYLFQSRSRMSTFQVPKSPVHVTHNFNFSCISKLLSSPSTDLIWAQIFALRKGGRD